MKTTLIALLAASVVCFPAQADTYGEQLRAKQVARQAARLQACADKAGEAFIACIKSVTNALEEMIQPRTQAGRLETQWALPMARDAGIPYLAEVGPGRGAGIEKPAADFGSSCLRSLCAHRPSYGMFRYTGSPNANPTSSVPPHGSAGPVGNQSTEFKFQFSLKTLWGEPLEGVQVWTAYTQQSHWQILNGSVSRPFRDTNYEPEVFINHPVRQEGRWPYESWAYDKLNLRMLGVGAVHQSNGQTDPISRSWNRIYAQGGFLLGEDLSLLAKVWYRVKEDARDDENPGIENFFGRGELNFNWSPGRPVLGLPHNSHYALRLRHSLRPSASHGSAQLEYSLPIKGGPLSLFIQAFHGYGENLLDYNHKQTTIGVGLGILDWGF